MKAAFAIGLLTKEQYEDLEVARKIRNLFAHDWEGVSLDQPNIKAMIGQLHGYNFDQTSMTTEPRIRLQHSISNGNELDVLEDYCASMLPAMPFSNSE